MKSVMTVNEPTLELPERLYLVLLSLYPTRFQARFGAEMLQTFRDCRRRESLNLVRAIVDLTQSVSQEWRREIADEDSEIDYTGLMDLFMITVVVGTHLLCWGLAVSAIAVKALGYEPSTATLLTCTLTVAAAAGIGFVSARIVARGGRVESHRITA